MPARRRRQAKLKPIHFHVSMMGVGLGLMAMAVVGVLSAPLGWAASTLFTDSFNYADGLITSEYTYWNPGASDSKPNANWEMTSGSLFASGQAGYSGVPDYVSGNAVPNPTTTANNNSAVFRLTSNRADFGDTMTSFRLKVNQLVTTSGTPAVDWDGIHIFLRYQSEYNLYYASVNRRDGHVVIKKKCVGGSSNGGTYYTLGSEVSGQAIPYGIWQTVAASAKNNTDGSVTLSLYREGLLLDQVTDTGVGCSVISAPGKTGIRGDNAEFWFDDFMVSDLSASSTPSSTAVPTSSAGSKTSPIPATKPSSSNAPASPKPAPAASAAPIASGTAEDRPAPTGTAVHSSPASTASQSAIAWKPLDLLRRYWVVFTGAGALLAALGGYLSWHHWRRRPVYTNLR